MTKPKRWREPNPADLPYHLQPGLTPEDVSSLPKWKRGVRERYERNKAEALAKAEPKAPPLPKHVQEKLDVVREALEDLIDLMSDPDTSNDDLRELMQEALDLESEEDWLMEGGDDEKPTPVITLLPDLIELLRNKPPGVYNLHPTVKEAGGSKSYAAKLTKLLKADPACPLARDLDRIGVTYVKASEGGYLPAPSVFVKRHAWD